MQVFNKHFKILVAYNSYKYLMFYLRYKTFCLIFHFLRLACSHLDFLLFESNIRYFYKALILPFYWMCLKKIVYVLLRCINLIKVVGECNPLITHSVQIRRFFQSVFSCIRTEQGEILCSSSQSVRVRKNTDQKNLCIWILFTQ